MRRRRIGRVLAAHHLPADDHQALAGRIPGHARGFDGDRPHPLVIALDVRSADEDELDEQHEPVLAVGVGQRLDDGSQHGDGVGDLAAECEPSWPGGAPQRRAGMGRAPGARRARAPARRGLRRHVPHRPSALEVDSVGDVLRRYGSARARSSSRAAVVRAPSRRAASAARRSVATTAGSRGGARIMLGDALVVQPRAGMSSAAARACNAAASTGPIASRAAAATTGCVNGTRSRPARARREARPRRRSPRRLEPGERARPRLLGVAPQHRDRASQ